METRKKKKIFIGIALGLAILIIAFLIAIPVMVMNPMVNMHIDFTEIWKAEDFGIQGKHFFVKTEDGLKISAYEVEVEKPKAVVVCLSGIHNPSATIFFGHARFFKEHNYATILFDMRAHGESDGSMICLGYKEFLDTKAIVQYIKSQPKYKNVHVVVLGLSMGGVTAINSIGEIPEINGLISLSAYSSWEDVFYENMITQSPVLLAKIIRPFVTITTSIKYRVFSWRVNPKKEIEKLGKRPALFMHTREDSQVPFANLGRILNHAPSHVETFIREGDIHFLTESFIDPEKDAEYSSTLIKFLDKHFQGK
jgi:uncharacterized protein